MRILIFALVLLASCMSQKDITLNTSETNQNNEKNNMSSETIYSFIKQGKGKWRVQDDVVMGGRSESQLKMTEDGRAQFSGRISLENNGGFCSIHLTSEEDPYVIAENYTAFVIVLKGDGKDYNFRVRTPNGRHSYGFTFSTEGGTEWERIVVPFELMEATYHGEPVDVPNYQGENVVEMQLLIGNKKEETFKILIESIGVK
ncbi:CIA30 family protein [Pontibacter cellulosilyticus]|uniref:CIA30 family protein n=1 Tax=Pontibacter cellulosilyticus TaxID=1720253 RepID=A0A923NAG8_9BACT|nr:CIA30 family protein [Pontibacter cellulosilyticus]MBC5994336.1 CIA30 family protein [Pontibacter cellulosilyticus]